MRALTEVVEQPAAEQTDGLWVKTGASGKSAPVWSPIAWSQLVRTVDYVSHWTEALLGPTAEGETVLYMGLSDVQYPIMALAALNTWYTIYLALSRNPQNVQDHFLDSITCIEFIHTSELAAQMQALTMHHSELDPLQTGAIFQHEPASTPYDHFCLLQEGYVVLILHSSDPTSLPKLIVIRTGALATMDTVTFMSAPSGRRNMHDEPFAPKLIVLPMPFFHIVIITAQARSIYHQGSVALLSPGQPAMADFLTRAIKQNEPSAATLAPPVLEETRYFPSGLEILPMLGDVFHSDAPLAYSRGDRIAQVTNLQPHIGNTEITNAPNYVAEETGDWEYIEHSADADTDMEPATVPSFEMVIPDEHQSAGIEAPTGLEAIKGIVKTALRTCLGSSDREYTDDDGIYIGGFDSLRVLALSNIVLSLFL
ncbi:acetyl-CoA synthetase-like protein [Aspergillus taichungensis]|uniref:Acetyl-CoA synthetase-like protein n=1 Tax=Aspergillus taichungensis TaxID=482145 RepID=A0A2J5HZ70_9EURO|nr:acetyl-CoA synthetase-like protein [Aspergillus taichungensis]